MIETEAETKTPVTGNGRREEDVKKLNLELSKQRSQEIKSAVPTGENQWSAYPQRELKSPCSGRAWRPPPQPVGC